MSWTDRLKDWAEDAVDDAGSWVKEQVGDAVGEEGSDLLDRASSLLGGSGGDGLLDQASSLLGGGGGDGLIGRVADFVGEQAQGSWAQDVFDAAKGVLDGGGDGLLDQASSLLGGGGGDGLLDQASSLLGGGGGDGLIGRVADFVGEQAQGSWAQDVFDAAKGVVDGGGDGLIGRVADFVGEQAQGSWAQDVVDTARNAFAGNTGIAGGIISPDQPRDAAAATMHAGDLAPAEPGGAAPGVDDVVGSSGGSFDTGTMTAPVTMETPADAATSTPSTSDDSIQPAPVPTMDEPIVMDEPAPQPTQFEASMAAADQVENSVDDMFADLG